MELIFTEMLIIKNDFLSGAAVCLLFIDVSRETFIIYGRHNRIVSCETIPREGIEIMPMQESYNARRVCARQQYRTGLTIYPLIQKKHKKYIEVI